MKTVQLLFLAAGLTAYSTVTKNRNLNSQPPGHPVTRPTAFCLQGENSVNIEDWRRKIDELDRQIVALISERARAAQEIGKLKRVSSLPVYEPGREKVIFENVHAANKGPLPDIELTHIYERIIDVMRATQRNELASQKSATADDGGAQKNTAAHEMETKA